MKIDFISTKHNNVKRDYLKRVVSIDKASAAKKAKNGVMIIGMDLEM